MADGSPNTGFHRKSVVSDVARLFGCGQRVSECYAADPTIVASVLQKAHFRFGAKLRFFFCQDCGFMVIVRPVLTIVVGVHTDRFGLSVACWKAGVALSKQGLMFANPF